MVLKIIIGIIIGGVIGAIMGYYGKCSSGACPLTANPWRGGVYGAVMGALIGGIIANPNKNYFSGGKEEKTSARLVTFDSPAGFNRMIKETKGVALVDFYAEWCGPCKQLSPVISSLADQFAGRAKVCKLNVDKVSETAKEFGIKTIPTVIIFNNGKPVERFVGGQKQDVYASALERNLKAAEEAKSP